VSATETTTGTTRKRNPYSIEELLKKPDKRIKVEETTSRTNNTVDELSLKSDHHLSDSELSNRDYDESDGETTKPIEVCD
jgi:hypothetical protein